MTSIYACDAMYVTMHKLHWKDLFGRQRNNLIQCTKIRHVVLQNYFIQYIQDT